MFEVWDPCFEWPDVFEVASSNDDDYLALFLLALGVTIVGRRSRLLFFDDSYRLRLSALVVRLLVLKPCCCLRIQVAYCAKFCKMTALWVLQKVLKKSGSCGAIPLPPQNWVLMFCRVVDILILSLRVSRSSEWRRCFRTGRSLLWHLQLL